MKTPDHEDTFFRDRARRPNTPILNSSALGMLPMNAVSLECHLHHDFRHHLVRSMGRLVELVAGASIRPPGRHK